MTSFNLQEQYRNYQDNEPTLLPDGEYTLQLSEIRTSESGDKLYVTAKVIGGPYAGKSAFLGSWTLNDKPGAQRVFFSHLRGFGLGESFFQTVQSLNEVATALEGRVATAKVEVRNWQGDDRNSLVIGSVKLQDGGQAGGDSGVVLPPTPDTAESVQADATAAPAPAAAPPPAPAPAPAPAAPPSADGQPLPF